MDDAQEVKELAQVIVEEDYMVLSLLIRKGVNIDAEYNDITPLLVAIVNDKDDMTRFLLDIGADPNHIFARSTQSYLSIAIRSGRVDMIRILLEYGANPDVIGRGGYTPLHLAILEDRPDIVELLLEHKADLSKQCKEGYSAIELLEDRMDDFMHSEVMLRLLKKHI